MAKQKEPRLKRGVGIGIGALLPVEELQTSGSSSINEIELSKIKPNPDQPRREFDAETLKELTDSIRIYGIIQPITLRKISEDNYMIIAGERRYRAAMDAGLIQVPAYIKTDMDENINEIALIENIQREDLNAIEIALAYQKLIETNHLTQEQLSDRVGKKRATIANYLRILKLPAEIQVGIQHKKIDMGHARALLSIEDPEVQLAFYEQIISQDLSVREVEEMVRSASEQNAKEPDAAPKKKTERKRLPDEYKTLEAHLSDFFKTDVKLVCNEKNGKGKITIPFRSESELEQLIALLDQMK